ncbi:hypothetical protein Bca52824_033751 [Brassica carinata]|uniref:DUF4283 domain-containing protein n=1 Tax=Brassica carinata TaxID=52824 RepID=A0A8X7V6D2_BRACI|nr:hypothetical protein Bca52824_033751 [Brassica carinata]
MGDAPHIGKIHAIVNRIWSFPDRPAKIDVHFVSPRTVLFRIDNPQLKDRVLKRTFWHIADIPIVGVPDHLFSHNGLTFFGETIGRTVKLHPNTERCVRLDVARLLVVMNLEEPLPASIKVRGSGEIISVSYPWLPPFCLGFQQWGRTDKTCSKNKHIKERTEDEKKKETSEKGAGTDTLQAGTVVANGNFKSIDIENPVLEVAHLVTEEASSQQSATKSSEKEVRVPVLAVRDSVPNKVPKDIAIPENEEPWLTIPQSSPSGRRNNGKSGKSTEVNPSTNSLSRFHLLSTELEEGKLELESESSSSDEESSVESKAALEKKKQMEKQKVGKNKKSQRSNPNVNVGSKKDQTKGAKNKQTSHATSRRH